MNCIITFYCIILIFIFFLSVLTVQFSKPTFSGSEASGSVSVTLMLGTGTSASPITITVTPFDQSPVSAQGKLLCPVLIMPNLN